MEAKIGSISGDGIGPEVVREARRVLDAVAEKFGHTFTYEDIINVNLKQNITLTDDNEIIVRTLTAPSVSDVKTENNTIKLTVDKELGVEIVGDTKVRINVVDDFDDYDEEIDDNIEINEDYLNSVN